MSSNIILSSEKVRELCEKKIARIQASRAKEWEAIVQAYLYEANNRWWRRLFKLKVSRQYIEALHAPQLDEIGIYYGYAYHIAQRLLQASYFVDQIRVSVEDFEYIKE